MFTGEASDPANAAARSMGRSQDVDVPSLHREKLDHTELAYRENVATLS
jgi:hypothetical protein